MHLQPIVPQLFACCQWSPLQSGNNDQDTAWSGHSLTILGANNKVQGFIQNFLVAVGKMMRIEPRLLRGGVGVCSPRNFLCSEIASGAPRRLEISY